MLIAGGGVYTIWIQKCVIVVRLNQRNTMADENAGAEGGISKNQLKKMQKAEEAAKKKAEKEAAKAAKAALEPSKPKKAGVEAGDVIISFNNKKVEKSRDLPRIVAETAVNEIVEVKLIRNGKNVTLKVKLGELEQAESSGLLLTDNSKSEKIENLGIKVSNLDETISKKFNLEINDIPAVVITEVLFLQLL